MRRRSIASVALACALAWNAIAAADSAVDSLKTEESEWMEIRDSRDPAVFEAYLAKIPSGVFVELAAHRLVALKPEAAPVLRGRIVPLSRTAVDAKLYKELDSTFFDTIWDSKNPDDFFAYLRKFPDGAFKALAEQRLGSLVQ
ncbi:hypothetical protein [Dongia sp.]|uniref:hypothetical protein n=1 Tax=Dongia sp. TaxID=1977262 RepID=UPI003750DDBA